MEVHLGPGGKPTAATASALIAAPPARVWEVVRDVSRYQHNVPMIHESKRTGDRVNMALGFKVAVFSAKFAFHARVVEHEERALEMSWISGEPRDVRIRFELHPEVTGTGTGTLLQVALSFDLQSLGWLVKYFLRHHPEIQFGVFPGSALALLDAVRRAA